MGIKCPKPTGDSENPIKVSNTSICQRHQHLKQKWFYHQLRISFQVKELQNIKPISLFDNLTWLFPDDEKAAAWQEIVRSWHKMGSNFKELSEIYRSELRPMHEEISISLYLVSTMWVFTT